MLDILDYVSVADSVGLASNRLVQKQSGAVLLPRSVLVLGYYHHYH